MRALQNCLIVVCAITIASSTAVAQMMQQGPKLFIAGSGPDDL